jgi:hypothetical protein
MKETGHVAHKGQIRNAYTIWPTKLTGKEHMEDL